MPPKRCKTTFDCNCSCNWTVAYHTMHSHQEGGGPQALQIQHIAAEEYDPTSMDVDDDPADVSELAADPNPFGFQHHDEQVDSDGPGPATWNHQLDQELQYSPAQSSSLASPMETITTEPIQQAEIRWYSTRLALAKASCWPAHTHQSASRSTFVGDQPSDNEEDEEDKDEDKDEDEDKNNVALSTASKHLPAPCILPSHTHHLCLPSSFVWFYTIYCRRYDNEYEDGDEDEDEDEVEEDEEDGDEDDAARCKVVEEDEPVNESDDKQEGHEEDGNGGNNEAAGEEDLDYIAAVALAARREAAQNAAARVHAAQQTGLDEDDLRILQPLVLKVEDHITENMFT
ncbi:hypothetical protein BJ165DRAFT_1534035 [Panaeolus papilionaceus]|nr:hypothetical protein BJ165DRAFT_1534035 [Panaeolus papilionaceus]